MLSEPNPYLEASDWGWQIDPVGLRNTLISFMTAIKCHLWLLKMVLVLLIKSKKMALFMTNTALIIFNLVKQMYEAIEDGVDLIGTLGEAVQTLFQRQHQKCQNVTDLSMLMQMTKETVALIDHVRFILLL